MTTTVHRVDPDRLHAYVTAIWMSLTGDERESRLLADHLVEANLTGHDSHGVGMLPSYVEAARSGALVTGGRVEVASDKGAVLTLDGSHHLGQVMAYEAMELAIERARTLGVAVVALRRSHHIGRIGHWAEQCARAGMASVHFVNVAGDALVAPMGGADARFGTNPFCAAFPRPDADPVLLDFATSKIALGKTRVAYNSGVEVPEGSVLDADGHPTTDPGVMWREGEHGALRTFGEHKGYGLALMCELFAGALTGGATTRADTLVDDAIYNDMLSIVLDPAAFDAGDAEHQAAAFLDWVASSRLMPQPDGAAATVDPAQDEAGTAGRIAFPGEPEVARRAHRRANGIAVDATTWAQIGDAARTAGLDEAALTRFTGED